MKKFKLYALVDPNGKDEFERIRYIGWTSKKLKLRLSKHLEEARNNKLQEHTYKNRWIKSLIDKNSNIGIILLEESDSESHIKSLEIKYIKDYKRKSFRLTNTTNGGDGRLGISPGVNHFKRFAKEVYCFSKDGAFIGKYDSATLAAKELEINSSKISLVCNGLRKSTGGYVFRFNKEDFSKYQVAKENKALSLLGKPVYEIDENGNILNEYASIRECCEKTKADRQHLSYVLRNKFKKNGKPRKCIGKIYTFKEERDE